jgi:hypothetical protein
MYPAVSNNGVFAQNPIDPTFLLGPVPLWSRPSAAYLMISPAGAQVLYSTDAAIVTDPVVARGPAPTGLFVYPLLWGPQRGILVLPPFRQQ